MGIFDNIVVILPIMVLLIEMKKYSNGEMFTFYFSDSSSNKSTCDISHNIADSTCNESISRNAPQYVPYTETFKGRNAWGLYRTQIRTNYKLEYHVIRTIKPKCCEGYVQIDITCVPYCSHSCEHKFCVPEVKCPRGHRISPNDKDSCVPVCTNGCINGTCIDVELCKCNDGYWMDADGFTCRPVCDIECERHHGFCVEPNICSCHSGYEKNEFTTDPLRAGKCEPICDACRNGRCVAPNVCSCLDGYEPDNYDRYYSCNPICDEGCAFGTCTAPGICTCDNGYKAVNASVCEPICSEPCVMGICVAPETCNCATGYSHGTSRYICMPICKTDCDNGRCTAPEVCTCNDGYVMNVNGHCAPICAKECINGTCTAPNRCTCDDGFAQRNASFCEPVCEGGCQNGDCIAPNQCVCHDNFIPNIRHNSSIECVLTCTRKCSGHGVCINDDKNDSCQCYFGWTGWDCDQPTMCVVITDFIHNDISKPTVYNDTNSTIMRAHENAPYCYQCDDDFLDTESLCYVVQSDEANTTSTIGCLLSTDLPCYTTSRYDSSSNFVKIVWSLVAIVILISTSLIAAAYLIYRRRQKKKLITARTSSTLFAQEAFATESLLSENVIYL